MQVNRFDSYWLVHATRVNIILVLRSTQLTTNIFPSPSNIQMANSLINLIIIITFATVQRLDDTSQPRLLSHDRYRVISFAERNKYSVIHLIILHFFPPRKSFHYRANQLLCLDTNVYIPQLMFYCDIKILNNIFCIAEIVWKKLFKLCKIVMITSYKSLLKNIFCW